MTEDQINSLKAQFDLRETGELSEIWQIHNQDEWTEEAFEAMRQVLLDRMQTLPPQEDRAAADARLDQVQGLLDANQPGQALEECRLAIRFAPHYWRVYHVQGQVLVEMDRLTEAKAALDTALSLNPGSSDVKKEMRYVTRELSHRAPVTPAQPNPQSTGSGLTQEDRVMSALAHLGIALPTMGLIIPLVIWVTQKGKSTHVAFHAFQALVYQITQMVLMFLAGACYLGSFIMAVGGGILASGTKGDSAAGSLFFLPFLVFGIFMTLWVLYTLYGVIGAIQTFRGKDFRYLWLGNWLEKRMSWSTPGAV